MMSPLTFMDVGIADPLAMPIPMLERHKTTLRNVRGTPWTAQPIYVISQKFCRFKLCGLKAVEEWPTNEAEFDGPCLVSVGAQQGCVARAFKHAVCRPQASQQAE